MDRDDARDNLHEVFDCPLAAWRQFVVDSDYGFDIFVVRHAIVGQLYESRIHPRIERNTLEHGPVCGICFDPADAGQHTVLRNLQTLLNRSYLSLRHCLATAQENTRKRSND